MLAQLYLMQAVNVQAMFHYQQYISQAKHTSSTSNTSTYFGCLKEYMGTLWWILVYFEVFGYMHGVFVIQQCTW
jgi:hypothetical protein